MSGSFVMQTVSALRWRRNVAYVLSIVLCGALGYGMYYVLFGLPESLRSPQERIIEARRNIHDRVVGIYRDLSVRLENPIWLDPSYYHVSSQGNLAPNTGPRVPVSRINELMNGSDFNFQAIHVHVNRQDSLDPVRRVRDVLMAGSRNAFIQGICDPSDTQPGGGVNAGPYDQRNNCHWSWHRVPYRATDRHFLQEFLVEERTGRAARRRDDLLYINDIAFLNDFEGYMVGGYAGMGIILKVARNPSVSDEGRYTITDCYGVSLNQVLTCQGWNDERNHYDEYSGPYLNSISFAQNTANPASGLIVGATANGRSSILAYQLGGDQGGGVPWRVVAPRSHCESRPVQSAGNGSDGVDCPEDGGSNGRSIAENERGFDLTHYALTGVQMIDNNSAWAVGYRVNGADEFGGVVLRVTLTVQPTGSSGQPAELSVRQLDMCRQEGSAGCINYPGLGSLGLPHIRSVNVPHAAQGRGEALTFAAGNLGMCLQTSGPHQSGSSTSSWTQCPGSPDGAANMFGQSPLGSVHFANASNGIVVGSGGTLYLQTSNGWHRESIEAPVGELKDAWMVDNEQAWIVGNNGVLAQRRQVRLPPVDITHENSDHSSGSNSPHYRYTDRYIDAIQQAIQQTPALGALRTNSPTESFVETLGQTLDYLNQIDEAIRNDSAAGERDNRGSIRFSFDVEKVFFLVIILFALYVVYVLLRYSLRMAAQYGAMADMLTLKQPGKEGAEDWLKDSSLRELRDVMTPAESGSDWHNPFHSDGKSDGKPSK